MLPIKIKNKTEFEEVGNDIVEHAYQHIKSICDLGYYTIKTKKKQPDGKYKYEDLIITVKKNSLPFFQQYNNKPAVEELIFTPADQLDTRVEDFYRKISGNEELKEDIKFFFVDYLYTKRFKNRKLIDSIGLKTCPYCNRGYIYTIEKGQVNPQLDHFYPKDKYPLFAVSLYNLIPTCAICNSAGCKGNKDTLNNPKYKLISPYLLTHDYFSFSYKLLSPDVIKDKGNGKSIDVYLDYCGCEPYDNVFHIRELYKNHDDHIEELLYKRKYVYTDEYLQTLRKLTHGTINRTDVDRFIVGAYVEKDDYHKRPLSKLYAEIAKEIGLIEDHI